MKCEFFFFSSVPLITKNSRNISLEKLTTYLTFSYILGKLKIRFQNKYTHFLKVNVNTIDYESCQLNINIENIGSFFQKYGYGLFCQLSSFCISQDKECLNWKWKSVVVVSTLELEPLLLPYLVSFVESFTSWVSGIYLI